jgi:acyl-CoA thioester hydrolase
MKDVRAHAAGPSALRPRGPIPTEGVLRVRSRYSECDPMGVVHHAAYIAWLEMGRTELLRRAGVSYAAMERDGCFLVVVRLQCTYRRPGHYDELFEVRTRVTGGSRVRIDHAYEVRRVPEQRPDEPAELLMTAATTLACVDARGRPRPLPDWLAESVERAKTVEPSAHAVQPGPT